MEIYQNLLINLYDDTRPISPFNSHCRREVQETHLRMIESWLSDKESKVSALSIKHWDPSQTVFLVHNALFDGGSLSSWIFAWTKLHNSNEQPMAHQFWQQLPRLSCHLRAISRLFCQKYTLKESIDKDMEQYYENAGSSIILFQTFVEHCVDKALDKIQRGEDILPADVNALKSVSFRGNFVHFFFSQDESQPGDNASKHLEAIKSLVAVYNDKYSHVIKKEPWSIRVLRL